MKKRALLVAGIMAAALLTGCGDSSTQSGSESAVEQSGDTASKAAVSTGDKSDSSAEDEDYSKYVTLGEYKGIELVKLSDVVSDEAIQEKIDSNVAATATQEQITTGTVKEGDTVNIDYEGKKDGVAFDGGTASGYDLTIGSGSFISGFEDGLIGVSVGETVDLNLTFPENYATESLAGQDVVFTVTVNSIAGEDIIPTLDDAWVVENSTEGSKTVEEYREEVKKGLEETLQANNQTERENAIMTILVNNSEISGYPEARVQQYKDQVDENLSSMAEAYGMDKDTFIQNYYGMTTEEYEENLDQLSKDATAQEMIVSLIADAEKITYTDEEVEKKIEEVAKEYGFGSADEFMEQYGEEKVKAELAKELQYDKVIQFVTDNAKFVDSSDAKSSEETK